MARRALVPRARKTNLPATREVLLPAIREVGKLTPYDVAALAREHTAAAIDALVEVLTQKDRRLRVAAATALLDRGWGKAGQPQESPRPLSRLSDEKLTLAIDLLSKAMEPAKPGSEP